MWSKTGVLGRIGWQLGRHVGWRLYRGPLDGNCHIGVRKRVIPVHLRIPGLLRRIHINERRPRRQDGIGRSGRDLGRDGRVLIHCSLGTIALHHRHVMRAGLRSIARWNRVHINGGQLGHHGVLHRSGNCRVLGAWVLEGRVEGNRVTVDLCSIRNGGTTCESVGTFYALDRKAVNTSICGCVEAGVVRVCFVALSGGVF